VIVADTGALLALLDAKDRHHRVLRQLFEEDPDAWVIPWAVLPEVDYLTLKHLGAKVELALLEDLAEGRYLIEWGEPGDLDRAQQLARRHRALELGLVDGVVIAVAERLEARAIATLDVRDFGAVAIRGSPRLLPRDL
jgi:hypothetical protein